MPQNISPDTPNKFAVVVGVDKYSVDPLDSCERDVSDIAAALEASPIGVQSKFIRCLTSAAKDPHKLPSRGNLLQALHWLTDVAQEPDTVFFFFSGHGTRIKGEGFLVPQDGHPTLPETLVSMATIKNYLNRVAARAKVILLDACKSGPDATTLKGVYETMPQDQIEALARDSKGSAVLCACSADEVASTGAGLLPNSVWCHFIIQALRGEPSALHDGLLTIDSLRSYAAAKTFAFTRDNQLPIQKPTSAANQEGTIIIASFRNLPATHSVPPPTAPAGASAAPKGGDTGEWASVVKRLNGKYPNIRLEGRREAARLIAAGEAMPPEVATTLTNQVLDDRLEDQERKFCLNLLASVQFWAPAIQILSLWIDPRRKCGTELSGQMTSYFAHPKNPGLTRIIEMFGSPFTLDSMNSLPDNRLADVLNVLLCSMDWFVELQEIHQEAIEAIAQRFREHASPVVKKISTDILNRLAGGA